MDDKLNQNVKNWISTHGCEAEGDLKMVADVRLFASDWEIRDFSGVEDKDSYNPLYAGQSDRIKALKQKPYWKLINPIYRLYANVKVRSILFLRMDKKTAFVKLKNKVRVKWKNRRSVVHRRNVRFLNSIRLTEEERKEQETYRFSREFKISVIVPLYNTPERYLRDMIESVEKQTFGNWELCLGDGSDGEHSEVGRIVKEYADRDPRIVYRKLERNEGISGNTNACLSFATGEYVALFDHDDMLHPSALFHCAKEIEEKGAELVYTDEMTFEHDSIQKIATLHFKPAYSPVNLLGVNYITHLCVFKKSLLESNGLYDDAYDGSQDHDMILRLTAAAKEVSHVPEILYFWRVHPQSVSADISAKPYAIDAGRRAVHDSEARAGREAEVHSSCICATHYRFEYVLPEEPMVTILITHFNRPQALAKLLSSIDRRSLYRNFRIVIADFGSDTEEAKEFLTLLCQNGRGGEIPSDAAGTGGEALTVARKMPEEGPAAFLNRLAAENDYTVFLDASMEIMDERWLSRLLQYEMQPQIGAAAGRLTDSYGMVNEAGYIIGLGEDGIAFPIEHKNNFSAAGYMGRMYYAHNISAASLYGMMVSKEKWNAVGGLSEELTSLKYLGIDLSLKLREKGYQVVLNPYVIHMQHEEAPAELSDGGTGGEEHDREVMRSRWKETLAAGDPYYNKHLNRDGSWTFEM